MPDLQKIVSDTPTAIELYTADGSTVVVADRAWIQPGEDGVTELWYEAGWDAKMLAIGEVVSDVPGRFEGLTTPNEVRVVVRHAEPGDAVGAPQFQQSYSLPLAVMGATMKGNVVSTSLEAMVGDDGYVRTVMLVTDIGRYLRYSRTWHELVDEESIDDYASVPITDAALDLYDVYDTAGQLVSLSSLPLASEEDRHLYEPEPDVQQPETSELLADSGLLAGGELPTIEDARDVPGAIEFADSHPRHRWYVERRIEALGLNIVVPWERRNE